MAWTLGRKDYEELMILGGEWEKHPDEVRDLILIDEYPKSTVAAAVELRSRGIDADAAKLDYLIKKGAIQAPTGGAGRNRRWTQEDIDRALAYLDREGAYVPSAIARMVFNLDAAQDMRAQQRAFAENPHLPPDASLFVQEIFPGAPGVSDPKRVAVVCDIFHMCVEGVGFKGIADELNRRGVLSPRGKLWAFTTIKAILENPVYRGDIVWNRRSESKFYRVSEGRADHMRPTSESGRVMFTQPDDWIVIEGAAPAIVDRETWDRAQAMVARRARCKGGKGKQTNRWLLSGVMRCGDCGYPYWGERKWKGRVTGHRRTATEYYTCSGRRGRGKTVCAHAAHVRAGDLETWVLGKLHGLVMADAKGLDDALDRFVTAAVGGQSSVSEARELEQELAEIDATVNALARTPPDDCMGHLVCFAPRTRYCQQTHWGRSRKAAGMTSGSNTSAGRLIDSLFTLYPLLRESKKRRFARRARHGRHQRQTRA